MLPSDRRACPRLPGPAEAYGRRSTNTPSLIVRGFTKPLGRYENGKGTIEGPPGIAKQFAMPNCPGRAVDLRRARPHRGVVEDAAAVGAAGVGGDQHVDAE